MKALLVITLSALALAVPAQAGSPSLCVKDGWATAQSDSGVSFASMKECAKAKSVFSPSLTISPTHVGANERFTLTASGFHANAAVTVYFAITGEAPYASSAMALQTSADGSWTVPFVYAACRQIDTGGDVTVDLTLTLTDSFGVHASASLTLC